MSKPTDQEILDCIARGERMMTYVIRNVLARKYKELETPWVRRRLYALEKAGRVVRARTDYVTQIRWAIPKAPAGSDK